VVIRGRRPSRSCSRHIPTEDGEERIAEVCLDGDRWKPDVPPLVELLEVIDATEERLREGSLSEAC
jgi:hypothetical protein